MTDICNALLSRLGWQKASGYNTRSRVEAAIERYEQVIGNGPRFRKGERCATEVAVAVQALNRMLALRRPISVRIKLVQMGEELLRAVR